MTIWLLLACGSNDPLPEPNPPPTPPPLLALEDATIVTLTGEISEVHPATRSWLVSADGQRTVAVLDDNGVLEVGGRTATPAELVNGATIVVTGRQKGDVMQVQRGVVAAPPINPPPPGETPADAPPTPDGAPAAAAPPSPPAGKPAPAPPTPADAAPPG